MKKIELQRWETILVACASALFATSFAAYVTGFPLRNYLFGLQPETGQEEIGQVAALNGSLKRELLGEAEFTLISQSAPLFMRDTIVTGAHGNATLSLSDGSTIELGPKTMVRLEGESNLALTGVSRTMRIALVSGQVTGKSAPTAKSRIVIQTRDQVVEVGQEAPKVIQVSNDHPVIPSPRPTGAPDAGVLNFFSRFTGKSATEEPAVRPELISTDAKPDAEAVVAAKSSPSPTPAPSPTESPTPTPIPSPSFAPESREWSLQLTEPRPQAKISLAKGSAKPEKSITFHWKVSPKAASKPEPGKRAPKPAPLEMKLVVYHLDGDGKREQALLEKAVTVIPGKSATASFTAETAGIYEWEVTELRQQAATGATLTGTQPPTDGLPLVTGSARFTLAKEFEGIRTQLPEAVDYQREDVQTRGKRFAKVRLNWKPYPTATSYKVRLFSSASGKDAAEEQSVSGTDLVVTQKSSSQAAMFYEVTSALPGGFVVRSAREKFIFDFPPPDPTQPKNQTVLTEANYIPDGGGVLLTWQKTGVSEGYVVEISEDASFRKVIVKKSLKDNFFLFRPNPATRQYWWRVSAFASGLTSWPSTAFTFSAPQAASP